MYTVLIVYGIGYGTHGFIDAAARQAICQLNYTPSLFLPVFKMSILNETSKSQKNACKLILFL